MYFTEEFTPSTVLSFCERGVTLFTSTDGVDGAASFSFRVVSLPCSVDRRMCVISSYSGRKVALLPSSTPGKVPLCSEGPDSFFIRLKILCLVLLGLLIQRLVAARGGLKGFLGSH